MAVNRFWKVVWGTLGALLAAVLTVAGLDAVWLFSAALIGEAMGGLVVYAILHAFIFSRGQPTQSRVFAVLASGLLLYVMFGGLAGK